MAQKNVSFEQINVIGLFLEDHDRIASLLNDFKNTKKSSKKISGVPEIRRISEHNKRSSKSKEIFKQLTEALTRHFHQEEILYSKYKYRTGEILPVLQTIRKEHSVILDKLDKANNSLGKGEQADVSGLFLLLERHKNQEDRLLYPELDRVLTDKEKEDVYWKIKVK